MKPFLARTNTSPVSALILWKWASHTLCVLISKPYIAASAIINELFSCFTLDQLSTIISFSGSACPRTINLAVGNSSCVPTFLIARTKRPLNIVDPLRTSRFEETFSAPPLKGFLISLFFASWDYFGQHLTSYEESISVMQIPRMLPDLSVRNIL